MENLKIQNDCNTLALLQTEISRLRQHKGCYLSNAFIKNIEALYYALASTICCSSKYPLIIYSKPEIISDLMVDCCLRCMEEILQNLMARKQQLNEVCKLKELVDLAQDLYILCAYIMHTVTSRQTTNIASRN
jgi:dihydrodipicolinate synthase/N-acetylneuraminate lyase